MLLLRNRVVSIYIYSLTTHLLEYNSFVQPTVVCHNDQRCRIVVKLYSRIYTSKLSELRADPISGCLSVHLSVQVYKKSGCGLLGLR